MKKSLGQRTRVVAEVCYAYHDHIEPALENRRETRNLPVAASVEVDAPVNCHGVEHKTQHARNQQPCVVSEPTSSPPRLRCFDAEIRFQSNVLGYAVSCQPRSCTKHSQYRLGFTDESFAPGGRLRRIRPRSDSPASRRLRAASTFRGAPCARFGRPCRSRSSA
jgi:hypothetical protein